MLPVALYVTAAEETCSNVTVSWTREHYRIAYVVILYNSTVHSNSVSYTQNASYHHTKKLIDLLADTEYNITVIAKYSDNYTSSQTVTANTESGTPSEEGIQCRSISN